MEFFADYARRFPVARNVTAGLVVDSDRLVALSCYRSHTDAAFGDDAARVLRALHPFVRHSLRLGERQAAHGQARALQEAALDRLHVGVILVGPQGDVLFANREAVAMCRADDTLSLRRRITFRPVRAQQVFDDALRGVLNAATEIHEAAFTVPRRHGDSHLALILASLPTRGTAGQPAAAVFLRDSASQIIGQQDRLRALFGLTPLEARVAEACANGQPVSEISEHQALTEQTVRWYLKQIFAKTGVRSQSQLVRLLTGLPPVRRQE
jgi:DNA-binding CsgD family transcriptional regulator